MCCEANAKWETTNFYEYRITFSSFPLSAKLKKSSPNDATSISNASIFVNRSFSVFEFARCVQAWVRHVIHSTEPTHKMSTFILQTTQNLKIWINIWPIFTAFSLIFIIYTHTQTQTQIDTHVAWQLPFEMADLFRYCREKFMKTNFWCTFASVSIDWNCTRHTICTRRSCKHTQRAYVYVWLADSLDSLMALDVRNFVCHIVTDK